MFSVSNDRRSHLAGQNSLARRLISPTDQTRRSLQGVRRRRHLTSLRTCSGPSPTNSGRDFMLKD